MSQKSIHFPRLRKLHLQITEMKLKPLSLKGFFKKSIRKLAQDEWIRWGREFCEDWRCFDLSLLPINVDRDKSALIPYRSNSENSYVASSSLSQRYFAIRIATAQKIKFSIKDSFSKCDQIRSSLRIWSHLLKNSLMKNFIFCSAYKVSTPPSHHTLSHNLHTFFHT